MDAFIQIPAARRLLAFQQVDEAMGLQAVSVEKDFWVCWTLRELFSLPGIGGHLTFKGGTSLSKALEAHRAVFRGHRYHRGQGSPRLRR